MLSGAETQARIERHDGLARPRTTTAPGRLDQQGAADLEWLEMFFPRLPPVRGRDSSNCDPAGADVQAAVSDFFQSGPQPRAQFSFAQRQFLAIGRNRGRGRCCVRENRRRPAK